MNMSALDSLFSGLSLEWETAINEKRQYDAIVGGVLGYSFFRGKGASAYERASLTYVRKAIDDTLGEVEPNKQSDDSQHACSFCYRRPPEVRLAAGANGFICDKCVSQLSEVFKEQAQSPA
jgi:hypothetical protein